MTTQRRTISSPGLDISNTVRPADGVAAFVLEEGVMATDDPRSPYEVLRDKLNDNDVLGYSGEAGPIFTYVAGVLGVRNQTGGYDPVQGTGGGGGASVFLGQFYEASTVALVLDTWVEVGRLTVDSSNTAIFFFDATADRTAGSATISLRVLKNGTAVRMETEDVEVSGQAEHQQVVSIFSDRPGGTATYTVEVQAVGSSGFTGTLHAREFLSIGSVAADASLVTRATLDQERLIRAAGDALEYIQIANVTQLASDRAAQASESSPKIFHLLTEMTYDSTDFKWGDTLLFGPNTTDYERGPNIPLYDFNYVTRHADTASEFNGYVNGHVGNDHYLFIRARGTFNATLLRNETYAVVAGETYWVYPRDYNPHRFISFTELANAAGYRKAIGRLAINPRNIVTYNDLDGKYEVSVLGEDADYLVYRNVDQWEFWIKSQAVESSTGTWTPASDFSFTATIDTSEETQIGLTALDKIVPIRIVYRSGGQYVAQSDGFLFIGDGGTTTTTTQPAKLTQEQEIGLLNFRVTPEFISYPPGGLDTALTRTIELRCANPELLTGDIWYQGSVDGQAVVTRAKWSASTSVIRFAISAQLAALVGQNPQLELDLSFYNVATGSGAGTLVETLRYSVPLQIIPRPLHQTVSATSANTSVNADNGLTCDMPISFNTTLTITGGEDGLYLTIRPTQDTTGSRTITYGGSALDISTAGKSRDFLLFQREGSAWVLLGIRKGGDL